MADANSTLTQARLKEILSYDPDSGIFTWKVRRGSNAMPGMPAGYIAQHGYIVIQLNGKNYYGHRLAWLYVHGSFPPKGIEIDHRNNIRSDNRFDNLRESTKVGNSFNSSMRSTNTSGVKGVYWQKNRKKWLVQVVANGEMKYIGYFISKDEAEIAARAAREKYHGDFANHGDKAEITREIA